MQGLSKRMVYLVSHSKKANKRFKRDSQRAAFLLCVGFGDYDVMRKVFSSVVCPLSGRYVFLDLWFTQER